LTNYHLDPRAEPHGSCWIRIGATSTRSIPVTLENVLSTISTKMGCSPWKVVRSYWSGSERYDTTDLTWHLSLVNLVAGNYPSTWVDESETVATDNPYV
jgi:hypothetical protein